MSKNLMAIVAAKKCGSPAKKSLLFVLAETANDDGSSIFKSVQSLAFAAEISKRSAQKFMAAWCKPESGLLKKVRVRSDFGNVQEYALNLDSLNALPPIDRVRGRNDCTGAANSPVQNVQVTGATSAPVPVQPLHPTLPYNPVQYPAARAALKKSGSRKQGAPPATPSPTITSDLPIEPEWFARLCQAVAADERGLFESYLARCTAEAAQDGRYILTAPTGHVAEKLPQRLDRYERQLGISIIIRDPGPDRTATSRHTPTRTHARVSARGA